MKPETQINYSIKRTVSIKFSDHYFQTVFYKDASTVNLNTKGPLYVCFLKDNFLTGEKAFLDEDGFCLMQSEKELQETIERNTKNLIYPIPTAQELWNLFMYNIIKKVNNELERHHFKLAGIVFSLPYFIEESLKQMIETAIECGKELFLKKLKDDEKQEERTLVTKIVDNNLSSMASYSRCHVMSLSSELQDITNTNIRCFIHEGLEYTEWCIFISQRNVTVALESGRYKYGIINILEVLRRKLWYEKDDENNNILHIKQYNRFQLNKLEEWLKCVSYFVSTEMTYFKDSKDDKIGVNRYDILKEIQNEIDELMKELNKSIEKVNTIIQNNDSIEVEGVRIELKRIPDEDKKVKDFMLDGEWKDWFLLNNMEKNFKFRETNGTQEVVLSGSGYISRMLTNEMIGEQQYSDIDESIHEESTIVEKIESKRFELIRKEVYESTIKNQRERNIVFPENECYGNDIPIGTIHETGIYVIRDTKLNRTIGQFKAVGGYSYICCLHHSISSFIQPYISKFGHEEKYNEFDTDFILVEMKRIKTYQRIPIQRLHPKVYNIYHMEKQIEQFLESDLNQKILSVKTSFGNKKKEVPILKSKPNFCNNQMKLINSMNHNDEKYFRNLIGNMFEEAIKHQKLIEELIKEDEMN